MQIKIMLEQVNMMFDCEEEVEEQVEFKLKRLNERLNNQ